METEVTIDVETHGAKELIRSLKRLKSTSDILDCGQYRNCTEWTQLRITTSKTESELEDWIFNRKFSRCFNANVVSK